MQFIIADDHPLFRTAITHTLQQHFDGAQVLEVGSLQELLKLLKTGVDADLLLLDLHIPDAHGFNGLAQVSELFPDIPVMIVSGNDNPSVIHKSVALGASGFLPKSTSNEDMAVAINCVMQGQVWIPANLPAITMSLDNEQTAQRIAALTPQQLKVLTMMGDGLYNKQIASELSVTDATVRAHVTEVFRKIGVTNRTQAGIFFNRLKVEDPHCQVM
jgi:DNA-binding NarL/FixJ family response regulator